MKDGANYFELQNYFWQIYRKHKDIKLGLAGFYGWIVDQFNINLWPPYMEWQKNELEVFTHLTGKTLTKYREILCLYNLIRYTKATDNRMPDKYELVFPVESDKDNGKNSRAKSRAKSRALYKDYKDIKDDSKSVEKEHTPTPTKDECINFFLANDSTEKAATKFYDYYQSSGWYRGKCKITNWESAAKYWIANDKIQENTMKNRESRNKHLQDELLSRYGPEAMGQSN